VAVGGVVVDRGVLVGQAVAMADEDDSFGEVRFKFPVLEVLEEAQEGAGEGLSCAGEQLGPENQKDSKESQKDQRFKHGWERKGKTRRKEKGRERRGRRGKGESEYRGQTSQTDGKEISIFGIMLVWLVWHI